MIWYNTIIYSKATCIYVNLYNYQTSNICGWCQMGALDLDKPDDQGMSQAQQPIVVQHLTMKSPRLNP